MGRHEPDAFDQMARPFAEVVHSPDTRHAKEHKANTDRIIDFPMYSSPRMRGKLFLLWNQLVD